MVAPSASVYLVNCPSVLYLLVIVLVLPETVVLCVSRAPVSVL